MPQPQPFDAQLAVGQQDAAQLRAMPPKLATGFARCRRAGRLPRAKFEDGFDGLAAELSDERVDGEPGVGDEFDEGQKELAIGLGELARATEALVLALEIW